MKAILICPEHRTAGGVFRRMKPLALMPVMGRSLLDHTLTSLKKEGFTDVTVLASDRPEVIREATGKGDAWGLKLTVVATPHELAPDIAELQHGHRQPGEARPRVIVLDQVPGLPGMTFWQTNFSDFDALRSAVESPELAAQLTMQEVSPRVWISTRARVSSKSDITGPAWIGPHATIGARAKIGPNAIVEAGAFIDEGASIAHSWIGPSTYVGASATIHESCAWGNGLLNWTEGSFLEVSDTFLLNDLTKPSAYQKRPSVIERLLAFVLMLITAPFALLVMLRSRMNGGEAFSEKRVILPPPNRADEFSRTRRVLGLKDAPGLLQRWPELWLVMRGDLALVGNRPLSPEEVTALRGPVGQLWLEHRCGVFSLADAVRTDPDSISKSLPHAAYFGACRTRTLRLSILRRCLLRFLFPFVPTEPLATPMPAQPL